MQSVGRTGEAQLVGLILRTLDSELRIVLHHNSQIENKTSQESSKTKPARHSWTDSVSGNYSNNINNALYSPTLDLSGLHSATLTFWHRYDLESGFDFGRVFVTTDNGVTSTQVASFTGINANWTQATIDLSTFAGQPSVRIVFQLLSNSGVTKDGWYIDDVAIMQEGGDCTYSLSAPSQSFSANGGTGNVGVTTQNGCPWIAVSNAPSWIMVSSGNNGSGNGAVNYMVAANTGPNPRRGTLTIGGKIFTVSQGSPLPPPCTISFSPQNKTFTASGGSSSIPIIASSSTCPWTAVVSRANWITITSGASGKGNGTVQYSVAQNTGTSQRAGRISIAGKLFTVTQAAP